MIFQSFLILFSGHKKKHSVTPVVTSEKVSMLEIVDISATDVNRDLIYVHGKTKIFLNYLFISLLDVNKDLSYVHGKTKIFLFDYLFISL